MEKSRTEYSTMNTVVAMISRIAAILMGFVTRVVFTHTLSESYVGINGLFTDILNVLTDRAWCGNGDQLCTLSSNRTGRYQKTADPDADV